MLTYVPGRLLLSLTSRRSQGRSLMRTARCVPSSRTTAWGSRRLPEPLLGSAHELDSWKRATQIQNFFIFRPAIGAAKISSRLSSMTDSGSRPRKPKRRSSTITTWGSWGSIQLLDLLPQLDLTSIDACFSKEEIWSAIKELPSDRAPGPDGFTGLFYKST
jgi:hypothetical protein